MERQRQHEHHLPTGGGGPLPEANLETARNQLEGMLSSADRVLDSIQPVVAEEYLQQSRQRGAQ